MVCPIFFQIEPMSAFKEIVSNSPLHFLAALSLILALSGCVTFGQMETGLNSLMGSSEQAAFNVLGYPSDKQQFGNDTVYTWYTNSSGTVFIPQVATTYGSVGRIPVYGTTTTTQAIPVNYNCTIKLIANDNGILHRWEYNGNIGGCRTSINRLNSHVESRATTYQSTPDTSHPTTSSGFVQAYKKPSFSDRVGKSVRLKVEPVGLYSEASIQSERIQRVYKNSHMIVEETDGTWLKVRVGGVVTGWIDGSMVSP